MSRNLSYFLHLFLVKNYVLNKQIHLEYMTSDNQKHIEYTANIEEASPEIIDFLKSQSSLLLLQAYITRDNPFPVEVTPSTTDLRVLNVRIWKPNYNSPFERLAKKQK